MLHMGTVAHGHSGRNMDQHPSSRCQGGSSNGGSKKTLFKWSIVGAQKPWVGASIFRNTSCAGGTVLCNWIFRKTSSAVGVHPVNMTPTISSTEVIFGAPKFRFRSIFWGAKHAMRMPNKTESCQIGISPAEIRYAFFLMCLSSLDMCRKARRSHVTSGRLVLARLLPDVASTIIHMFAMSCHASKK